MRSRRDFLIQSAGLGIGSGLLSVGAPAPGLWRQAVSAAEPRPDATILVVIELTGGNDGLNTVVPHSDDIYHKSRPTLRIEPNKVLKLDDRVGLHPSLNELHALWKAGDLAVVQGVGYPNPNRSHFRSMEIWQTGVLGDAPPAGWLGRAGDAKPGLGLCHVGQQSVPLAMRGRKSIPQSLASLADYRLAPGTGLAEVPAADRSHDPVLGEVQRQFAIAQELATRLAAIPADRGAAESLSSPETLEGRLRTIQRLIEADLPARVYVGVHHYSYGRCTEKCARTGTLANG